MLQIGIAVVLLGIVVYLHEVGHWGMARLLKVEVAELSLGFGKRLWGRVSRRSGVAYTLRLLPFGGYTRFLDEDDVSGRHGPPQLHYMQQPVWKRTLITAAGPVVNLLLALTLCGGLWVAEHADMPFVAQAEGTGQELRQVWEEPPALKCRKKQALTESTAAERFDLLETVGGVGQTIVYAGELIREDGLRGVVTIAIALSACLGGCNLIPLPGLDGSQLLLLLLEKLRGRQLSDPAQTLYSALSLLCLGGLTVLTCLSDLRCFVNWLLLRL